MDIARSEDDTSLTSETPAIINAEVLNEKFNFNEATVSAAITAAHIPSQMKCSVVNILTSSSLNQQPVMISIIFLSVSFIPS